MPMLDLATVNLPLENISLSTPINDKYVLQSTKTPYTPPMYVLKLHFLAMMRNFNSKKNRHCIVRKNKITLDFRPTGYFALVQQYL